MKNAPAKTSDTKPKQSKRRPVRDITKYCGIIKGAANVTDEELDRDRYEYLSKKHGPISPGPLNFDHLELLRRRT